MSHDATSSSPSPAPASHPGPAHDAGGAPAVIALSGRKFMIAAVLAAAIIVPVGRWVAPLPVWLMAAEVFATILGLFLLGSFKYQLHKNPLTYGMGLVIFATFLGVWWQENGDFGKPITGEEVSHWGHTLQHYLLSFHGLDDLVHIDTMLFILGLTFFVAVIAQTRLLEAISFSLLRANKGFVLPTVIAITAVVSVASGIFDGVSMIGLTIRTLVIILLLAQAPLSSIRYAVMVCTAVTTICGMWLAYGEPPNLIMKANLVHMETGQTFLNDMFFLRYCLPGAVLAYLCVAWSLRRKLAGTRVDMENMDVLDTHAATVRFLQAARHGEVLTPVEFVEAHRDKLHDKVPALVARLKKGEALGVALVREDVPIATRRALLAEYTDHALAQPLDQHYELESQGRSPGLDAKETEVKKVLVHLSQARRKAQTIGIIAMLPFVGLLITHGLNHHVPLCLASLAGFAVAMIAIWGIPKMRKLALHEAWHEYAEYYFLFPLFLSISLLTAVGFFDQLQDLLKHGIEHWGTGHVGFAQFTGATFLSAILDNNVVADFASRALIYLGHHPDTIGIMYVFALSQIAGYATGGCWTHIGCAQSVVAYSFIQRDVDSRYTPVSWIKEMTPVLVSIFVVLTAYIYLEAYLLKVLHG